MTQNIQTPAAAKPRRKRQNMVLYTLRRMLKNRVSMVGFIIIIAIILACVLAPVLAPYDPDFMDYTAVKCRPCLTHLLGTDHLGRDILSRLLWGGRSSLALGFICAIVGMFTGVFFGCLVGYAGGNVDLVVMRICDIMSAIPGMLLSILISAALGPGFGKTILAMTLGGVPGSVRASRAMALKEREMEYLEAATATNCSSMKIIFRHMMPNIVSPTIVSTTMMIGNSIMSASGLSYIGLGIQPPAAEWGAMLSDASKYLMTDPHMIVGPGVAIIVTVLAINMIGDGLRDALDPKLKD